MHDDAVHDGSQQSASTQLDGTQIAANSSTGAAGTHIPKVPLATCG